MVISQIVPGFMESELQAPGAQEHWYCAKQSSCGLHTPASLVAVPRSQPCHDLSPLRETLYLEPGCRIYGQFFDSNGSIKVGHFAGTIALLWFTPWEQIKKILHGELSLSSVSLHLSGCFMRYTKNLVKTAKIPSYLLPQALFYILKFRQRCRVPFVGSATSEARILVTALMVADKYEDDVSYSTRTWAKISSIRFEELKKMEVEFLKGLGFDLGKQPQEWRMFEQFLATKMFPIVDRLASMW